MAADIFLHGNQRDKSIVHFLGRIHFHFRNRKFLGNEGRKIQGDSLRTEIQRKCTWVVKIGPLARPLTQSLAPLNYSLTPHCSLRSRASLRSSDRSLYHSLTPELMGKRFISMNQLRRFLTVSTHCGLVFLVTATLIVSTHCGLVFLVTVSTHCGLVFLVITIPDPYRQVFP